MNVKYAFAIIAIFVGIVATLFLYFRNILVVVNFLFMAGIATAVVGAFIACKIPHFAIRRPVFYAHPPFDTRRRSIKTGLFIIAIGAVMMLMSIIIWELAQSGIF